MSWDFVCISRVDWTFKTDAGPLVQLTDGFYPAVGKVREFHEGKYELNSYHASLPDYKGYLFRLSNYGKSEIDWFWFSFDTLLKAKYMSEMQGYTT